MRLSAQTSGDIQTQHQDQSAFHGCCSPTDHEGLPSLPRSSSRHRPCQRTLPPMAPDADNSCHTLETLKITTAEKTRKRNNACDLREPSAQTGKPKHTAALAQHTNRRTCSPDQKKLCTVKRVPREAVPTQRRAKVCQLMFAVGFADAVQTLSHAFTRCIFIWTVYHNGHVTTLYPTECGSVRTDN